MVRADDFDQPLQRRDRSSEGGRPRKCMGISIESDIRTYGDTVLLLLLSEIVTDRLKS